MTSQELNTADLPASLPLWLAAIPATPESPGWRAAAASLLEAAAAKPGNVHPAAGFADLHHGQFVQAALAMARPLERLAAGRNGRRFVADADACEGVRVGTAIREAIEASVAATGTNTNLGIVLAIAPLAAARLPLQEGVGEVLTSLDRRDAADIWEAIATARPGGLGQVATHDLQGPAPDDILAAMRAARDRDAIARLWADGYADLFRGEHDDPGMIRLLEEELAAGRAAGAAIVAAFLRHLARHPDSLIARRHGATVAREVSRQASHILQLPDRSQPAAIAAFDATLRTGRTTPAGSRPINPGTTADLVAAGLFVLLSQGWTIGTHDR